MTSGLNLSNFRKIKCKVMIVIQMYINYLVAVFNIYQKKT